jgi:hypothetical protein
MFTYLYSKYFTNEKQNEQLKSYHELEKRMKMKIDNFNGDKSHYYKPHIVTVKSKQILSYINSVTTLKDKLVFLEIYNEMLRELCKKLYVRFDPHLIYAFNNEINLVFFYNENGNFIYDGNINKTITAISSYTSVQMTKLLNKWAFFHVINLDNLVFTAEYIQFDKDYETLNYLIWRQSDCKRNTITLLYKCLRDIHNVDAVSLKTMINDLKRHNKIHTDLLTGNIIKKQLVYDSRKHHEQTIMDDINCTDMLTSRKEIVTEHFYFKDDFKENLYKYIKNKIC